MPTALLSPVVDDATRREFLTLIAAAGLVAGCATPAAEPRSATRTVVDATGTQVEVPDAPRRIVALYELTGAQLLAVGAPVVGMAAADGRFRAEITDQFDVGTVTPITAFDIAVEEIARLAPDLIVERADDGEPVTDPGVLDLLRAVAPVAAVETFATVEESVADLLDLLGSSATADVRRLQAELDTEIAALRPLLAGVTVGQLYLPGDGTVIAYGPSSFPETDVLTRAGASWAPANLAAGTGFTDLSPERLGEAAGDLLVIDASVAGPDAVDALPTLAALPAVVEGRTIVLRESRFGVHHPNLIALARTYREQLEALPPLVG